MVTQEVVVTVPGMTTAAYVAQNQVGTLITVPGPGPGGGSGCRLAQVSVVDGSKQSAALNVFLFSAAPTVTSVDHAAVDVSGAQLALYGQSVVTVPTTSYVPLANASIATVALTNQFVKPAAAGTIYALVNTTGTPTYAASALTLRFLFVWD